MPPATAAVIPCTPSALLTISAYASMMPRIARLDESFEAHELKKRHQVAADKINLERLIGGLRELDERMINLAERMGKAEGSLSGDERHRVASEARLHHLEGRTEKLEEDIDVIKAAREVGPWESGIKQEANDTNQERSHSTPPIPPPIPPPMMQEKGYYEEYKPRIPQVSTPHNNSTHLHL
ncbi:hypothetical protein B9Z19DRAFT_1072928 [Tuber borchii]|uniref:Uncharacterized protein n=1 Tax=Tuber borchii TaxID=42251 RepID=A0A2T7A6M3_TUBBO|nr:hypothetical protein B9Z19DRAFT_1072928 [Tuber borchii]